LLSYAKRWIGIVDISGWFLVIIFFLSYAFFSRGDIALSLLSSFLIILIMTVVSITIEVIIDFLKHKQGIGSILGFITNGPEMLVLVVGISTGDALFGVSTPLGSNIINPLVIVVAAVISGVALKLFRKENLYGLSVIIFTVGVTLLFYTLKEGSYAGWAFLVFGITFYFFYRKPKEGTNSEKKSFMPRWALSLSVVLLVVSGYFLDPVVEFAGEVSNVPKGSIGFFALALLSSWPELKSCLTLFRRRMIEAAVFNIFVSNITNTWLGVLGVVAYLLFQT